MYGAKAPTRVSLVWKESQGQQMTAWGTPAGAHDLNGIAHIEVDVWMILRRSVSNALELAATNAHDRHPNFIVKLRITFHLQLAAWAPDQ